MKRMISRRLSIITDGRIPPVARNFISKLPYNFDFYHSIELELKRIRLGGVVVFYSAGDFRSDRRYLELCRAKNKNAPMIYVYSDSLDYDTLELCRKLDISLISDKYEFEKRFTQKLLEFNLQESSRKNTVQAEAEVTQPNLPDLRSLAERLELIADHIADLRINSAMKNVEDLRVISQRIHHIAKNESDSPRNRAALKNISHHALLVLVNLFEVLGSTKGAQVIISGAAAGILGSSGWSTAIIYTVSMAAWQGKEAFAKAVEKVSRKIPRKLTHTRADDD